MAEGRSLSAGPAVVRARAPTDSDLCHSDRELEHLETRPLGQLSGFWNIYHDEMLVSYLVILNQAHSSPHSAAAFGALRLLLVQMA